MAARRRSDSELPHAPLELLHPLLLPGADIPGAEILGELGCTPDATTLLQLYRAVLAWSAHPENSPALDSASLERTEFALLSRGDDPLASPAGLLAGYMAQPEAATQREVAWVCICIADWATERGARATALRFTEAAALAWPRHARYAWMVARMLRAQNKVRESEAWFRRAHRVAVWSDDWEAQARTLNSLGNLNRTIGRLPLAKRLNLRARRVAHRHDLTGLEAEVTHDLFITSAEMKAFEQAEAFAAEAFKMYGRTHPRLPMLMHDVAQFWVDQGHYERAFPVLTALVRRFDNPSESIRVLAAATHAAGALGLL
ncbi:MAG TPA: tetratricopeptide repeat protein, partial [Longimicrobium sp.]